MKVRKFTNTLHLKLETPGESFFEPKDDALFWNDLYIETSDGWLYLYDTSQNRVCLLDYDILGELKTGKMVVLQYQKNDPDYEFNHKYKQAI